MEKINGISTAGIDVSSTGHVVSVDPDLCENSIRTFGCFTADLHELAKWLVSLGVCKVALESTGVYWFPVYTILEDYGLNTQLIDSRSLANVPGRKSDPNDASWIQRLHSHGLLSGCFQPDNLTRSLRGVVRKRKQCIQQMTRACNQMEKAFEMMNLKLGKVISSLITKTGLSIVEAILKGERNAEELVKLADIRIKASKQDLILSLQGNYREEELFSLELAYSDYKHFESQLLKCDQKAEQIAAQFSKKTDRKVKKGRRDRNQPLFNVEQFATELYGVDVTKIPGIKATGALTLISELGPNIKSKFPTVKQFQSWLNVVPDNSMSGGKIIKSKVKKKKNTAGQAFRDAANTLWRANNPLGDYLREKKKKADSQTAIVATARKLSAIFYKMVTDQVEYDQKQLVNTKLDQTLRNIEKHRRKLENLEKLLKLQVNAQPILT